MIGNRPRRIQGFGCLGKPVRAGGHLWLFFRNPLPGDKAKHFGQGIAEAYALRTIEVFPKQAELGEGTGSLIRMPFGIPRKSGCCYGFITPQGKPIATPRKQLEIMCHPEVVPGEAIEMFQYRKTETRYRTMGTHGTFRDIRLLDFLGRFMKLTPTPSGAIGFCPFHDDQKPSFGVNSKGNYWNCFAGCGGGDIVSFWMKYQKCDYPTALKELEEVLHGNTTG